MVLSLGHLYKILEKVPKDLKIGKVTSWPQLRSGFWSHMPVSDVASHWPRTFLHYRCFC